MSLTAITSSLERQRRYFSRDPVLSTAVPPMPSFLPQQIEESLLVGSWRALRLIEEGEAVAVSYLLPEELRWSCSARRDALRQRFGFHCACARCCTEDICLDDMD